jgi:ribosomal protein S18 acetylase RimI-like enzyme
MKLLMENWRKFLIKENYSVEKEDDYVIYRLPQGYIKIIENSPYAGGAHSIYGFYVDEEHRGKGIGKQLVKIVVNAYPNEEISAQVSSLSSLKVFLDLGFRVTQEPSADFERAKELFDENYGSLNVRLNNPEMEGDLNEGRGDPAELKKDISDYLNTGPQKDGSPYKNVKKHLKGKKKKSDISAPPGAPGGGSIGHGSLEESD